MNDEKLIELVQMYKELYDLSHEYYMVSKHKEKIWTAIGKELNHDADKCKKRWNNIRDNFRKNLQRRRNKNGQSTTKFNKYKYEDQLQFLIDSFAEKDLKCFLDKDGIISDEELSTDDEKSKQDTEHILSDGGDSHSAIDATDIKMSGSESSTIFCNPLVSSQFVRPSEKVEKQTSIVKKLKKSPETASSVLMQYLLETTEKTRQKPESSQIHPVDTFLAGISSTLKGLNPYFQNIAKSRIFGVVQSLELEQIMQTQQSTPPCIIPGTPPPSSPSPGLNSHSHSRAETIEYSVNSESIDQYQRNS